MQRTIGRQGKIFKEKNRSIFLTVERKKTHFRDTSQYLKNNKFMNYYADFFFIFLYFNANFL